MKNACLCAALEYLEQDFSVIPINGNGNKKPLVAWTEFQKLGKSFVKIKTLTLMSMHRKFTSIGL